MISSYEQTLKCIVCQTCDVTTNDKVIKSDERRFCKVQNSPLVRKYWCSKYNIDDAKIPWNEDIYVCSLHWDKENKLHLQNRSFEATTSQNNWPNRLQPDPEEALIVVVTNDEDTEPNTERISNFLLKSGYKPVNSNKNVSGSKKMFSSIIENIDEKVILEKMKTRFQLLKQKHQDQRLQIRVSCKNIKRLKNRIDNLANTLKTKYNLEETDESDFDDEDDLEDEEL